MRPIVQSTKKYIQRSLLTVAAGTTNVFLIARAIDIVTAANEQVITGSIIKAVYVEMWVRSGELSPGTVLVSLIKIPGDAPDPNFSELTNLTDYQNKKNVLYHTQGLTNDSNADAIPFIRGWFKIPKGKQRFGKNDGLVLAMSAQALDSLVCGFATYKAYT